MLDLHSILLFSENPKELVGFFKKVRGKDPEWHGGDFAGLGAGSSYLTIGPHDKVHGKKSNPKRIMVNVETDDVVGACKRIACVGAKVIAEPYHPSEEEQMWIATLTDPDGNYFQLMSAWEQEEEVRLPN